MPKLREQKITADMIDKYRLLGPCVKPGMEVWMIEGKKLSMGVIEKVDPDRISIKKPDGTTISKSPVDAIMLAEPAKEFQKALKKNGKK